MKIAVPLQPFILSVAVFAWSCGSSDSYRKPAIANTDETESLELAEEQAELRQKQSFAVKVKAPLKDNYVSSVKKGDILRFETLPDAVWVDFFIVTTAAGFASAEAPAAIRAFMQQNEAMRRLPKANWFELSGCVVKTAQPLAESCFRIGTNRIVTMPSDGELSLFANDLPGYYGNNFGEIAVKITRQP
jgi:hypothetical protein